MSIKQIRVCDGCGREFLPNEHPYHLALETDTFFDGYENDTVVKSLEFCELCAMDIKKTLSRIVELKEDLERMVNERDNEIKRLQLEIVAKNQCK